MTREEQVKEARDLVAAFETIKSNIELGLYDFEQRSFALDKLDVSDHLDVHQAAVLAEGILKVFREAQRARWDRHAELETQVVTRADLRRWLEERK